MSPVHKKKKKTKRSDSLLNTKTKWLVWGAALACVAVIVAFSMSSGGQFKDISYIPRGEGTLFDNASGNPTGNNNHNAGGSGDTAAPPHPNQATLPEEYSQPAPHTFSPEQKHKFIEKKYTFLLENQKEYYDWELKRLLQAAKSDYLAVKNGHQDISLSQLASEYLRVGRSLEKEADRNFSNVMNQLKSELKANNLPQDLVKQAEKEYQEQKSQMHKELLGQIEGYNHD